MLPNGPVVLLMVAYLGEGAVRYSNKIDARKRIHDGENIVWTAAMLTKSHPYYFVDNELAPELESNHFMSLCFNYLLLRYGNSFIIEHYSLHRFGRWFGFYQNVPSSLENNIRSAPLDEGLRFWRICILYRSMSRAAFPSTGASAKTLLYTNYMS